MPAWLRSIVLLAAFELIAMVLYWPATDAAMFSDDSIYTVGNPWVADFSVRQLGEIWNPHSGASALVLNFAPINLMLHSISFAWFGPSTFGHHIVNIGVHGLVSFLLVGLLVRAGLGKHAATLGGLLFLVHPANVEAVAWISQLKTIASSAFALTALSLLERRPAWATAAFTMALLTKALAAFALPVAAVWLWTRSSRDPDASIRVDRQARWLGLWGVLFVAIAIGQLIALTNSSLGLEPPHAELDITLRSSVALVTRYLVMSTTTLGLSAFHEIAPTLSWLDPWWLAGLLALAAIAGRGCWALVQRREEAGWWAWAAVSFLPVSQLFPFQFAMADRYLYLMLPGLIGAMLLAIDGLFDRVPGRQRRATAMAVGVLAVLALGARTIQRVEVWKDPNQLVAESIANYPAGVNALIAQSERAALIGDGDSAMAILTRARDTGDLDVSRIADSRNFASLRGRSDFRQLIVEWADLWIDKYNGYEQLNQYQLFSLGQAYEARRDRSKARHAYQRGLAQGGVYDGTLRRRLRALGY